MMDGKKLSTSDLVVIVEPLIVNHWFLDNNCELVVDSHKDKVKDINIVIKQYQLVKYFPGL